MVQFVQDVIGGLGFGAVYALAALGLVVIFKTSRVVNFAFGSMGTATAMLLWTLLSAAGLPPAAAWLLALTGAALIGALADVSLLRRIERTNPLIQITLTLGLFIGIEGLTGVLWGYTPKTLPQLGASGPLRIGPYFLTPDQLLIIGLTVVLAVALYVVLERTRLGLAMRGIAQDRDAAMLMGVPMRAIVTQSWAWGVLLSGLAAILVTPSVGLSPTMMDQIAVFAFAAAVLGGVGSLAGAVVGGFVVGVVGNLISAYVSTNFQLTFIFLLIVAVLYVRPQGIFGVSTEGRR
jgi:branched-chain amino acid transport system permease protein